MLDVVQIGLDVVGAIPGVGIAANVVNAGISLARGDKLGAGLSLVACIPIAGPLAKGAKMAKAIGKAVPGLAKGTGKVMNTVQKARNIAQTAFQEVLSVVKPLKGKMTTGSKIAQNKVVKDLVEIKTAMKAALDKVQSNLGGKMATEFAFDAGYSIGFEYMAEKTGVDLSLFSLLGTRPKRNLGATSGGGSSSKNRNKKSNGNGEGNNRKESSKGTDKTRPSWRQSEIDVGKEYPGYRDQVSYKDGNEVSHGTKNSSRPDFYTNGHSIEVKNYNLTTSSGRSNLIRNVSKQVNKRISDLPEKTKQTVIIDVRGQNVSRDVLRDVKQKINDRTNGVPEIIFKMD